MLLLTTTLLMAAISSSTSFHSNLQVNSARVPASVASIPLASSFPSSPQSVSLPRRRLSSASSSSSLLLSTWDDFSYDDDDELLETPADANFVAADENDDPSVKAAAGMALDAPEVDYDGPVIQVPQGRRYNDVCMRCVYATLRRKFYSAYKIRCGNGNIFLHENFFSKFFHIFSIFYSGSALELSEETVQGVLAACREEIG